MSESILVTGGAGYLGSVLVPELLFSGYEVTVLDNFYYRQMSLAEVCYHPKFQLVKGDCRDAQLMRELVKQHDIIIPLAALVGAPLCDEDPINAQLTNEESIRLLAKILSKEQQVLMPITNSGYGIGENQNHCTEESPLNPISLYGRTKVNAEKIMLERENSISFRLATVFGFSPRMRIDLLVNDFVWRAVNDKAVILFESHFKRNFIHIRDVARAFQLGIVQFSSMKQQAFNVGLSDANLSKWELCEKIKQHLPDFVFLEAPIGEDPDKRDYLVANDKIEQQGFQAQYSLNDGIVELIKGYKMLNKSLLGNI